MCRCCPRWPPSSRSPADPDLHLADRAAATGARDGPLALASGSASSSSACSTLERGIADGRGDQRVAPSRKRGARGPHRLDDRLVPRALAVVAAQRASRTVSPSGSGSLESRLNAVRDHRGCAEAALEAVVLDGRRSESGAARRRRRAPRSSSPRGALGLEARARCSSSPRVRQGAPCRRRTGSCRTR